MQSQTVDVIGNKNIKAFTGDNITVIWKIDRNRYEIHTIELLTSIKYDSKNVVYAIDNRKQILTVRGRKLFGSRMLACYNSSTSKYMLTIANLTLQDSTPLLLYIVLRSKGQDFKGMGSGSFNRTLNSTQSFPWYLIATYSQ